MNTTEVLKCELQKRVMFMDGGMGTMIQNLELSEADFRGEQFAEHPCPLQGNNDCLVLTQPHLINNIHKEYLYAGADFISTNTFNSTSVAMADYSMQDMVYELNYGAAKVALAAAAEVAEETGIPRYVIGVLGPTNKTLSISPSVEQPAYRNITFEELVAAYSEQAGALLDAQVHVLMVETIFDTLNAKAALYAIDVLLAERDSDVPVFVSSTIVDLSGRTLSGQTVEGMVLSLAGFKPLCMGLNCALGAAEMRQYVRELGELCDTFVSCYPNAGLPNEFGGYDQSPEQMATILQEFGGDGLVNIVGGCCGTTPAHIRAIAQSLQHVQPRIPHSKLQSFKLTLSGLEPMMAYDGSNFINIGERCNVAGSIRFKKQILNDNYTAALEVARQQIEEGAQILDINVDDGMIDGVKVMSHLVRLIAGEPDIARVPLCIDSSDFQVIEAGLQCTQGKCIVNSISLKEGLQDFLDKAETIRRYGAAVVVMAFDETGQADTLERKIEVCERAYRILIDQAGFRPCDIIFDPNVLTIGTGLAEHNAYGESFIAAVKWIKENLPGALVSGGISNVSFAFRGNNVIRQALHSVFLYHATQVGLDMGIVHAGNLPLLKDIDPVLRELCEDLIWNRNAAQTTDKLLAYAKEVSGSGKKEDTDKESVWRCKSIEERLQDAVVDGYDKYIVEDVEEYRALHDTAPALSIIEGPLLDAMNIVGDLFGSGKMFLPQVIKSARVMKKAVHYLTPFIEAEKAAEQAASSHKGLIVIATVKGDVHDIGKNIVGVVLGCNNFKVIDLGVMCPLEKLLDVAAAEKADIIGVSGLITPSLREMVKVAQEMSKRGLTLPLLIGGATTSRKHTAVKIWPEYPDLCVYVPDASCAVHVCTSLVNKDAKYLAGVRELYQHVQEDYQKTLQRKDIVGLRVCRENRFRTTLPPPPAPLQPGLHIFSHYPLQDVIPLIDWKPFFDSWQIRGRYPNRNYPKLFNDKTVGEEAKKLFREATELLESLLPQLQGSAVVGIFPAHSTGDDVVVEHEGEEHVLYMLRQQVKQHNSTTYTCTADFIGARGTGDHIGMFCCSVFGAGAVAARYERQADDYSALLVKTLADRLVEALTEHLHLKIRREIWGYNQTEDMGAADMHSLKYQGTRPAPGYPSLPDHTLKYNIWELLSVQENIGTVLTESCAMDPAPSVCGLYLAHPQSYYFNLGQISKDQVQDYAERRGFTTAKVEEICEPVLGYEPVTIVTV